MSTRALVQLQRSILGKASSLNKKRWLLPVSSLCLPLENSLSNSQVTKRYNAGPVYPVICGFVVIFVVIGDGTGSFKTVNLEVFKLKKREIIFPYLYNS